MKKLAILPLILFFSLAAYNGYMAISDGVGQKVNFATVTLTAGGAVVNGQSGTWIASATRVSAGLVDIVFAANTFSAAPGCACTAGDSGGANGNKLCGWAVKPTSSGMSIQTNIDPGGSNIIAQDYDFTLICVGPR